MELVEKQFDIPAFEPETSSYDNIKKWHVPYQPQQLQRTRQFWKDRNLQLPLEIQTRTEIQARTAIQTRSDEIQCTRSDRKSTSTIGSYNGFVAVPTYKATQQQSEDSANAADRRATLETDDQLCAPGNTLHLYFIECPLELFDIRLYSIKHITDYKAKHRSLEFVAKGS
ncbi:unnamed protein product [Mytilus coruscus]|uniref:Uncharacterized protein n=1 Tax=Mytilus coruscus TaxID=42192 RepID=A0A6J8ENE5_MYTCO|nr:unnamed protein product [Mytilus coruscus]